MCEFRQHDVSRGANETSFNVGQFTGKHPKVAREAIQQVTKKINPDINLEHFSLNESCQNTLGCSQPREPADQNKHATSSLPAQTLETLSQIFLRSYLPRQMARPALFITWENRKYLCYAQTSAQSPHRNNIAHYSLMTGKNHVPVHTRGCDETKPCRPHRL